MKCHLPAAYQASQSGSHPPQAQTYAPNAVLE
jgi:hypothetical protein